MAAYAAVVSLMNTLEHIKNHPRHSLSLDKKQTQSLFEKLGLLEEFLEKYSHVADSSEIEALESQIASAVHRAEDVIESHIVDQIHARSISLLDLQQIMEDMDSLKESVRKLQEEREFQDVRQTTFSTLHITTHAKSKMVGCDEELIHVMDLLTGQQSGRKIIPIVGMGGLGKTTLARNVYDNLLIVQRFDIRLWVTVSQEYNLREILSQLIFCIKNSTSGLERETNSELGQQLHKGLYGRRYLIVLDDMWSIEAWDEITKFVPANNNGSRIVVTTRESNLATHLGPTWLSNKFLDENASWNLFCEKAFAEEGCPPEFEATGKEIAEKCKGLPLSIAVIGGLLGKSTRTQEYWENIAKDINSVLLNSGEEEQCLKILSLSYRYLPAHLKPCFLYMTMFPEDYEIHVSRLIKLWVAEGFLKSKEARSLEEVAECHFKDLVDRNLILVRRLGLNGKIKTCSIHDLVGDLCLRVAEKEKFLIVMRSLDIPQGIDMARRIVCREKIEDQDICDALGSAAPLARSLVCRANMPLFPSYFRLLRVWNVVNWFDDSPYFYFKQVNLRLLANSSDSLFGRSQLDIPSSISNIWNVLTIIIKGFSVVAPSEIWDMTQLRHLSFNRISLPEPPSHPADQQDGCSILRDLQTLETVLDFRLSEEVCKRIPNLKKLKMHYRLYSSESHFLFNVGRFHHLESLLLSFYYTPDRCDLLLHLTFPNSLKKLYLENSNLHWEDMKMIGPLPHLEVLELRTDSVLGTEWSPIEGEFLRLKSLLIRASDLIKWNADRSHFPVLENIAFEKFYRELDEIPSGIGEIPTLKVIRVRECSKRLAISAVRILEEQESLGNEGLQVRIEFSTKKLLESFKEKMEQELDSFTSNNIQIERWS